MKTNLAATAIQNDTHIYDQWAAKWQMKYNTEKLTEMYIGLKIIKPYKS